MRQKIFLLIFALGAAISFHTMDKDFLEHQSAELRSLKAQWQKFKSSDKKELPTIEKRKVETPTITPKIATVAKPEPVEEPQEVREVRRLKTEAFSEMNRLHAQLLRMDDDERHSAALRIVELDAKLETYWQAINDFEDTGKVPDPEGWRENEMSLAELPHAQLVKMRNTDRSYISKNKGKADKQDKVAEREERIWQIEQIIG